MTANDLRGRTALVTGGSRGIGAAISRALAEAEARPSLSIIAREPTRQRSWPRTCARLAKCHNLSRPTSRWPMLFLKSSTPRDPNWERSTS